MEIIKRYQNRKLYSTTLSRYVTLDYVIDLIKTNQRFTVFDNKSKKDITTATIKQTIQLIEIPLATMTDLIRSA